MNKIKHVAVKAQTHAEFKKLCGFMGMNADAMLRLLIDLQKIDNKEKETK